MKTKKKNQTNTYFVNYCLWLVSTGSWANVLGFGINACGFGVCWCYFCDSALEPGAFSARTTHTEKKQSSLTQQRDATTWPIAARPASSQLHTPRRNQLKHRGGHLNSSISTPRPHAAQLHRMKLSTKGGRRGWKPSVVGQYSATGTEPGEGAGQVFARVCSSTADSAIRSVLTSSKGGKTF